METPTTKPAVKAKPASPFVSIRVKRETKRKLMVELGRVNRKQFGRPVTIDDVLMLAVCPLRDEQVKGLQDSTLSNSDRLEIAFREHASKHPGTTKDEFLGTLLVGQRSKISAPVDSPTA